MTVPHGRVVPDEGVHTPFAWIFADAASRVAFTPSFGAPLTSAELTSLDIHRVALQLDTGGQWRVASIAPVVWAAVGGGSASDLPIVLSTRAAITLYVDGDAEVGDDSAAGTAEAPLLTLAEALARVPSMLRHDVLIRIVTAGTYACPSFDRFTYAGGQFFIYGEPVTTDVATTAALTSSSASVVKTSGATVDAHRGRYLEVMAGPGLGDRRQQRNNTATDLVPSRAHTAAITTSSTYRVIRPAVVLDFPVLTPAAAPQRTLFRGPSVQAREGLTYRPGLSFANVTFTCSASPGFSACTVDGDVGFFGCDDDGTTQFVTTGGGRMLCGLDRASGYQAVAPYVAGLASSTTAWAGYGYTSRRSTRNQITIAGYWVGAGLISYNGETQFAGGNLYGAGSDPALELRFGAFAHVTGSGAAPAPLLASASAKGTIYAADRAFASLARCSVTNSHATGGGLCAENAGNIDVGHASNVTGACTGYGTRGLRGGRIVYSAGADGQEITGAIANFGAGEVPGTPTTAFVSGTSFSAEGEYISSADGSVVQRAA